jgi:hypothetical protein
VSTRGPVLGRRAALGLGVLGLGGLGLAPVLAACAGAGSVTPTAMTRPGTTPPGTTPPTPRVRTVWANHADGPLPGRGDEGLPLGVVLLGATVPPAIGGRALVGNLPDAHAAAYLIQPLPGRVRSLGARFGFTPGSDNGSLCLASWIGRPPTDTNCHMVLAPDRWIFSVARGNTLSHVDDGPFAAALPQDGSPLTVQVDLDGGPTAVLRLPDGQVRTVVDARIGSIPGSVAGWEFFRNAPGGADVLLYESWAA